MCNGQCVHPHPPPSPFVFDRMVEQDPKDVVDHLGYFLLLWVFGVDVSKGEHPVLPHGALQQAAGTQTHFVFTKTTLIRIKLNKCKYSSPSPPVFPAVTEEFYHVGKKKSSDFHQLGTGRRVLQQGGNYL